jgi:hypothetical protein
MIASTPEMADKMRFLSEIFGGAESAVEDELHQKSVTANSDEERLYYCLQFAHHTSQGKRGHKAVRALVDRAPGPGWSWASPKFTHCLTCAGPDDRLQTG